MKKESKKVEIPAELRSVITAAAKNLATHAYGAEGPAWGTSFADIEELAVQISRSLGSQLMQQALQRQANQPPPAELQACPACSAPLEQDDPQPRSQRTRLGISDWQEPARFCPR